MHALPHVLNTNLEKDENEMLFIANYVPGNSFVVHIIIIIIISRSLTETVTESCFNPDNKKLLITDWHCEVTDLQNRKDRR